MQMILLIIKYKKPHDLNNFTEKYTHFSLDLKGKMTI